MAKLLYTTFSDTYDCRRSGLARGNSLANSSYKGLAQKNSVVIRKVVAEQLPRLAEVCESVDSVDVEMIFHFDDFHRICVNAKTDTLVHLECHLCQEPVVWPMRVEFDALVASSEAQAEQWLTVAATQIGASENIVVAAGQDLDVAELIEDELILQLPRQVCFDDGCERRPVMHFHAADAEPQNVTATDRQLPFQGLKELVEKSRRSAGDGSQE